jgi:hypothetical protein
VDEEKKKSIEAYNKEQDRKAKLRADRDEWEKAKAAAPYQTPKTLSAYKQLKRADNDKYKSGK